MGWIETEIEAVGGAVDFRHFMELALYHPEHGYYAAGPRRPGRTGDYLTAPTASAWYGRVVARLLGGLADAHGPLRLVDVAAGDGSFLAAVDEAAAPGVVGEVVAVERAAPRRAELTQRLRGLGVAVVATPAEVEPALMPTVVHASELYDAVPVHRVIQRGADLCELWVEVAGGRLTWAERPAAPVVAGYFAAHGVELVAGQVAEANLAAATLHAEVLELAGSNGVALVLDYGYPARRLYAPRGRMGGSLATFRRHRVGRDPFEAPGEQDLTAHVNWDDLRRAAAPLGWSEIGLMPLAELLVRGGLEEELAARGLGPEAELTAAVVTARQEVKRLLDPDGMGSDLEALVQGAGAMGRSAAELLS